SALSRQPPLERSSPMNDTATRPLTAAAAAVGGLITTVLGAVAAISPPTSSAASEADQAPLLRRRLPPASGPTKGSIMKILGRMCAALALCASLATASLVNASPADAASPPYLIHS